jgi:hypothetical protein
MSVREFTDEDGRHWQAWDIRPEAIHPQTRAEDYLAECYVVGWIVFETTSGDEKRRLCPWPTRWAESTDDDLRALLARAERVPPHKLAAEREAHGDRAGSGDLLNEAAPAEDVLDVTDLAVVRTFRYPGGRYWTVSVVPHPEHGGPPVLRFTAGMRFIDLKVWPKDWADAPDDRLIDLMRRAAPRQPADTSPGAPRRRWTDQPRDEGGPAVRS